MRVVVIGAGIVGAAVAAGLTRRGARVTVLEERFPGAGSTGTAFGWVHADDTGSEPYFTLSHAAVHAHHALGGDGFGGHLACATGEHREGLQRRVDRLGAREYSVERITAPRAADLEPSLSQNRDDIEYAFFPEEGYVFPAQLLGRLLGEAREGGARIEIGTAAREVGSGKVVLADGGVRVADFVVVCAGRWTDALVGGVTPAPAHGFVVTTTPLPARVSHVLTTEDLDVRPDGGGRLVLRARDLDGSADPDLPPEEGVAAALLERLPKVFAHTEGVRADRVRVGRREGERLAAGFRDDAARVYSVTGDSGVILAPLLADLIAGEIYGRESAMLGEFRPLSAVPSPS